MLIILNCQKNLYIAKFTMLVCIYVYNDKTAHVITWKFLIIFLIRIKNLLDSF